MGKPRVKSDKSSPDERLSKRSKKNLLKIKMGSSKERKKIRNGKLSKALKSNCPEEDVEVGEDVQLTDELLSQIEEIEIESMDENKSEDYGRGFEKLSTSKKLQTMKRNPQTGQYECPYCVFCSPYYSAVASHTLIHTGEKPFRCKVCGYRARQRGHVVVHMQMHQDNKPYQCMKCDYSTSQPTHLRIHMRVHTEESKEGDKNSAEGDKYYEEQMASLKEQMKNEEESTQLFNCDQCEYTTKRKHNLLQHLAIHTGAKPYKCDLCNYSSSQKGHLNVHIRTHTREKPFKCPKCPFASTVPKSLREHLQMHYGQRPLKCPYCSFSSSQAFSIKRHIALHEEIKTYACKFCSYRTTVEEDFNAHRSIHTQTLSYKCSYCSYESPFKHIFDTHVLTHPEVTGITEEHRAPKPNVPSIRARQGVKNRLRNTRKNEMPEGASKKQENGDLHVVASATSAPSKVPKASPTPGMEPEELIIDVESTPEDIDPKPTPNKPVRKQTSPTPNDTARTISTSVQTSEVMPEPTPTPEKPKEPEPTPEPLPAPPTPSTDSQEGSVGNDPEPMDDTTIDPLVEIEIENPMDKLFTCEYCDRELVGQEDWRRHVSRHFMEWPDIN